MKKSIALSVRFAPAASDTRTRGESGHGKAAQSDDDTHTRLDNLADAVPRDDAGPRGLRDHSALRCQAARV